MTPAQLHISFAESFSAGMFPIKTVGEPTTQGAAVTGMHGMGVRTPWAAAVAVTTVGFVGALHMPNGRMLTVGLLSMMFAHGVIPATRFAGKTANALGVAPKLHFSIPPMHAFIPIFFLLTVL
jgi:hypothetical protein